jgi:two-component system catabolic regulation response regulator CreB
MDTILIVEDEPAIADNVVYALETEGFRTRWVRLGAEGLEVLRSEPVRLVILDIGLPDGNGFEFCKAMRSLSDVPVVFLTARSDEVDRVVGLEIGADDYVVKPFSPRELAARVKAILRRAETGSTSPAPSDSDFEVDREGHTVRYRGRTLSLTRSELMILTLLLEHPGRVFSRRQIMERVWEAPDMSQERAVDSHIKTLRTKLREVAADHDPIRTHRGLGYSLAGRRS